ncbi:hypothetical protein CF8_0040 [Aeromonas phage CF8]|nr:hypothetical protein CF8_0040 [Aeromonas phage CF8]
MNTQAMIKAIFTDQLLENKAKAYKNVYDIKSMSPGDRLNFFSTFRYRLNKIDVLIVGVMIRLENPNKNVRIHITHIKLWKKYTKTIFRQGIAINHKSIYEILDSEIPKLLAPKLEKAIEVIKHEQQ